MRFLPTPLLLAAFLLPLVPLAASECVAAPDGAAAEACVDPAQGTAHACASASAPYTGASACARAVAAGSDPVSYDASQAFIVPVLTGIGFNEAGDPCGRFSCEALSGSGAMGAPTGEAGLYYVWICFDVPALRPYQDGSGAHAAAGIEDTDGDGHGDTPYAYGDLLP